MIHDYDYGRCIICGPSVTPATPLQFSSHGYQYCADHIGYVDDDVYYAEKVFKRESLSGRLAEVSDAWDGLVIEAKKVAQALEKVVRGMPSKNKP